MDKLKMRYRLDESQFFYDYADGLAIIINSTTGMYYGINTFGSAIYNQLVNGASPESILEELHHLPACPKDIDNAFVNFIARLQSFGLLVEDENIVTSAQPFDTSITTEGLFFEVEEFADIQEVLLADPIHDVDSEYGWPILKLKQLQDSQK